MMVKNYNIGCNGIKILNNTKKTCILKHSCLRTTEKFCSNFDTAPYEHDLNDEFYSCSYFFSKSAYNHYMIHKNVLPIGTRIKLGK